MDFGRLSYVTRSEEVCIKLGVNITKKNRRYVSSKMKVLDRRIDRTYAPGDIAHVNYRFSIDYLNNVNTHLSAILALISRDDVRVEEVSMKSLNHSKILIREIILKINQIEKQMVKRGGVNASTEL